MRVWFPHMNTPSLTLQKTAFFGASWLAFFKILSQLVSWTITIAIARILSPGDYGLMEMATILTGYVMYFNELGIGSAIVQNKDVRQRELSSIFWFILGVSLLLGSFCFFAGPVMASFFREPRITPLIRAISLLFPINGLLIVPMALLNKNLQFKTIGYFEAINTAVGGIATLATALLGGGVWSLVAGLLALSSSRLILAILVVRWLPDFHCTPAEVKKFVTFGATVTAGRSFFYMFERSDKFFAGKYWSSINLGLYGFALQLASIPTEKITVLINQVSFPIFSRLQENKEEFNAYYLNITMITATLVVPIFVGGYLTGADLIRLLLNEKWYPIIPLFKYLCLTQIVTSLNAVNSFVHYSQGRPHYSMYYHAACAAIMGTSFYVAVRIGFMAILVPWFTSYVLITALWTLFTLRTMGITAGNYLKNIQRPFLASGLMIAVILLYEQVTAGTPVPQAILMNLVVKILLGSGTYLGYLWFFDRRLFLGLQELMKK